MSVSKSSLQQARINGYKVAQATCETKGHRLRKRKVMQRDLPSRSGHNLMSLRLCEGRQGSGENQGKRKDQDDSIRRSTDVVVDGGMKK